MPGKVGFIGLGNMGGPMALNLAKAGFSLVVHDIDSASHALGLSLADARRARVWIESRIEQTSEGSR